MGSSHKGSAFEREVCKILSYWASEGEHDDWYWRSSQSGGRATQRAKSGKRTVNSYGDIAPQCPEAEWFTKMFCIECKKGYTKDTDVLSLIDSKQAEPTLVAHFNQCKRDKEEAGSRHELVIFKRDRKKACIMVSLLAINELETLFGNYPKSIITFEAGNKPDLAIMLMEDFFEWIDPITLKEIK